MIQFKENTSEREQRWYPLYTRSRHEKKAYERLRSEGFEAFLPLKKSVRQWSDRKKVVQTPLFPSYVFAKLSDREILDAIKVRGVASFVSFNGRPANVREEEIEAVRSALQSKSEIEVIDGEIEFGAKVKFRMGILGNYEGKVIRRSGKNKLVIEIGSINKTMLVTVDKSQLKRK